MFESARHLTASAAATAFVTGILALGMPAVTASAAPAGDGNDVTTVGETTVSAATAVTSEAELDALLQSATPKVITIDPVTNTVESVTEMTGAVQTRAVTNGCASGALCWLSGKTPYANFGFSGAGTYTGGWEWRGTMKSNNWGGQLTYTINKSGASSTTPVFGHNSEIKFTNTTVNNIKGLKVLVKK